MEKDRARMCQISLAGDSSISHLALGSHSTNSKGRMKTVAEPFEVEVFLSSAGVLYAETLPSTPEDTSVPYNQTSHNPMKLSMDIFYELDSGDDGFWSNQASQSFNSKFPSPAAMQYQLAMFVIIAEEGVASTQVVHPWYHGGDRWHPHWLPP